MGDVRNVSEENVNSNVFLESHSPLPEERYDPPPPYVPPSPPPTFDEVPKLNIPATNMNSNYPASNLPYPTKPLVNPPMDISNTSQNTPYPLSSPAVISPDQNTPYPISPSAQPLDIPDPYPVKQSDPLIPTSAERGNEATAPYEYKPSEPFVFKPLPSSYSPHNFGSTTDYGAEGNTEPSAPVGFELKKNQI